MDAVARERSVTRLDLFVTGSFAKGTRHDDARASEARAKEQRGTMKKKKKQMGGGGIREERETGLMVYFCRSTLRNSKYTRMQAKGSATGDTRSCIDVDRGSYRR